MRDAKGNIMPKAYDREEWRRELRKVVDEVQRRKFEHIIETETLTFSIKRWKQSATPGIKN